MHVAALRAVAQGVVDEDDGHQRFGDGRGADAHAGIVPSMRFHRGGRVVQVHGLPRQADARCGFDGDGGHHVLPGADAAEHAAGVVRGEALRGEFVAMLRAFLRHAGKACADLHTFHRVQAHERVGDVGVELVVERLAPACGHAAGGNHDARADRVARFAQRVHIRLQLGHDVGVGREKRVLMHRVPGLEGDGHFAELGHAGANRHAVLRGEPLLGHRTGGDDGRGQPGRRATAAARIAQAVFAPVGVVGMAGAEGVQDVAVVLAALVGVADEQGDGRAGGLALEHAGEDFHLIGFLPLRHMATGAGAAAVEIGLDVGLAQRHARRTAVDHATDGRAMGFAEGGDCKQQAEGVAGHGWTFRVEGEGRALARLGAACRAPRQSRRCSSPARGRRGGRQRPPRPPARRDRRTPAPCRPAAAALWRDSSPSHRRSQSSGRRPTGRQAAAPSSRRVSWCWNAARTPPECGLKRHGNRPAFDAAARRSWWRWPWGGERSRR